MITTLFFVIDLYVTGGKINKFQMKNNNLDNFTLSFDLKTCITININKDLVRWRVAQLCRLCDPWTVTY